MTGTTGMTTKKIIGDGLDKEKERKEKKRKKGKESDEENVITFRKWRLFPIILTFCVLFEVICPAMVTESLSDHCLKLFLLARLGELLVDGSTHRRILGWAVGYGGRGVRWEDGMFEMLCHYGQPGIRMHRNGRTRKKMPSDIHQVGNGQKNHEHNWSFFLLYSSSL